MIPARTKQVKNCYTSLRSACILTLIVSFVSSSLYVPSANAQAINLPPMPMPGVMVHLSPEFTPALLKGIVIHPEDALKFDFIVYKGDKVLTDAQKRDEYGKLAKYFLASLAIPDDDQWVNLSPYEKDRIIKDDFGKTEMGRDLLAQDYILKQITASLIYPEDNLGKKFWDRVYSEAQKQYGTTEIPVNTFNKVWIVPDSADIYEKGNTAYVYKSHLKVMMEEDYLSLQKHSGIQSVPMDNRTHSVASKIVKEIVLPALEKEINEGKNFAALRQVFSGMVLAAWYKKALKESFLSRIYADKAKVKGVDQDPKNNELIYHQYLRAYKKGVFNFIKEDVDKYTNETIPRKYFSGGFASLAQLTERDHLAGDLQAERETGQQVSSGGDDIVNMLTVEQPLAGPVEKQLREARLSIGRAKARGQDARRLIAQQKALRSQLNATHAAMTTTTYDNSSIKNYLDELKAHSKADFDKYIDLVNISTAHQGLSSRQALEMVMFFTQFGGGKPISSRTFPMLLRKVDQFKDVLAEAIAKSPDVQIRRILDFFVEFPHFSDNYLHAIASTEAAENPRRKINITETAVLPFNVRFNTTSARLSNLKDVLEGLGWQERYNPDTAIKKYSGFVPSSSTPAGNDTTDAGVNRANIKYIEGVIADEERQTGLKTSEVEISVGTDTDEQGEEIKGYKVSFIVNWAMTVVGNGKAFDLVPNVEKPLDWNAGESYTFSEPGNENVTISMEENRQTGARLVINKGEESRHRSYLQQYNLDDPSIPSVLYIRGKVSFGDRVNVPWKGKDVLRVTFFGGPNPRASVVLLSAGMERTGTESLPIPSAALLTSLDKKPSQRAVEAALTKYGYRYGEVSLDFTGTPRVDETVTITPLGLRHGNDNEQMNHRMDAFFAQVGVFLRNWDDQLLSGPDGLGYEVTVNQSEHTIRFKKSSSAMTATADLAAPEEGVVDVAQSPAPQAAQRNQTKSYQEIRDTLGRAENIESINGRILEGSDGKSYTFGVESAESASGPVSRVFLKEGGESGPSKASLEFSLNIDRTENKHKLKVEISITNGESRIEQQILLREFLNFLPENTTINYRTPGNRSILDGTSLLESGTKLVYVTRDPNYRIFVIKSQSRVEPLIQWFSKWGSRLLRLGRSPENISNVAPAQPLSLPSFPAGSVITTPEGVMADVTHLFRPGSGSSSGLGAPVGSGMARTGTTPSSPGAEALRGVAPAQTPAKIVDVSWGRVGAPGGAVAFRVRRSSEPGAVVVGGIFVDGLQGKIVTNSGVDDPSFWILKNTQAQFGTDADGNVMFFKQDSPGVNLVYRRQANGKFVLVTDGSNHFTPTIEISNNNGEVSVKKLIGDQQEIKVGTKILSNKGQAHNLEFPENSNTQATVAGQPENESVEFDKSTNPIKLENGEKVVEINGFKNETSYKIIFKQLKNITHKGRFYADILTYRLEGTNKMGWIFGSDIGGITDARKIEGTNRRTGGSFYVQVSSYNPTDGTFIITNKTPNANVTKDGKVVGEESSPVSITYTKSPRLPAHSSAMMAFPGTHARLSSALKLPGFTVAGEPTFSVGENSKVIMRYPGTFEVASSSFLSPKEIRDRLGNLLHESLGEAYDVGVRSQTRGARSEVSGGIYRLPVIVEFDFYSFKDTTQLQNFLRVSSSNLFQGSSTNLLFDPNSINVTTATETPGIFNVSLESPTLTGKDLEGKAKELFSRFKLGEGRLEMTLDGHKVNAKMTTVQPVATAAMTVEQLEGVIGINQQALRRAQDDFGNAMASAGFQEEGSLKKQDDLRKAREAQFSIDGLERQQRELRAQLRQLEGTSPQTPRASSAMVPSDELKKFLDGIDASKRTEPLTPDDLLELGPLLREDAKLGRIIRGILEQNKTFDKQKREITTLMEGLRLGSLAMTPSRVDHAAFASRQQALNPGGIDLNSINLNLRIKRDGHGVPLPWAKQDMAQIAQIDGLVPVILDIEPATSSPVLAQLTAA